jgi:hypothetical protein
MQCLKNCKLQSNLLQQKMFIKFQIKVRKSKLHLSKNIFSHRNYYFTFAS